MHAGEDRSGAEIIRVKYSICDVHHSSIIRRSASSTKKGDCDTTMISNQNISSAFIYALALTRYPAQDPILLLTPHSEQEDYSVSAKDEINNDWKHVVLLAQSEVTHFRVKRSRISDSIQFPKQKHERENAVRVQDHMSISPSMPQALITPSGAPLGVVAVLSSSGALRLQAYAGLNLGCIRSCRVDSECCWCYDMMARLACILQNQADLLLYQTPWRSS